MEKNTFLSICDEVYYLFALYEEQSIYFRWKLLSLNWFFFLFYFYFSTHFLVFTYISQFIFYSLILLFLINPWKNEDREKAIICVTSLLGNKQQLFEAEQLVCEITFYLYHNSNEKLLIRCNYKISKTLWRWFFLSWFFDYWIITRVVAVVKSITRFFIINQIPTLHLVQT